LLELIRSCGLDLDCLRIASLSLAHRAQFLVAKVLTTPDWIALPEDAAGHSFTLESLCAAETTFGGKLHHPCSSIANLQCISNNIW